MAGFLAWAPHARAQDRHARVGALVDDIVQGNGAARAVSQLRVMRAESEAVTRLGEAWREASPMERERIADALADLPTSHSEEIVLGLARDEDSAIRQSMARALGVFPMEGHKRLRALQALLADPTLGVRRQAAVSIGRARLSDGGKLLAEAARSETSPEVREAMLVAVGQAGDAHQGRMLVPFLSSASESTRLAAARGLCLLGDKAGIAYARNLFDSKQPSVRRSGVLLFDGAGAKAAGPALRPMINDPDPSVSASAARVLAQGGDATMVSWLVLQAEHSHGEARLVWEDEIEKLQLSDEQRQAILERAAGPRTIR